MMKKRAMTATYGNAKYLRNRSVRFFLKQSAALAVAVFVLTQASVCCAQNIRVLFEAGWKAYEEGRFPEARKLFETVIDLHDGFAPAYYALGKVCYDEIEERSRCLWYFQKAVQIDPKYASAYEGICRIQYESGNHDAAEETCLKALSLDPKLYSTKLLLAWVYLLGKQDPERALQYFDSVMEVAANPIIRFGKGMAHADKGDHAQVVEIITQLRAEGAQEFANHLEMVLRSKVDPQKLVPLPLLMSMTEEQMLQEQAAQEAMMAEQAAQQSLEDGGGVPANARIQIQGKVPIIMPQVQVIQGQVQPQQPAVRGGQSVEQHPGGLTED